MSGPPAELGAADLAIANAVLVSIAEEMGEALGRSAYSPNIKERRDYSCAVFDHEGAMVAQAAHMPVHLGAMPAAVRAVLEGVAAVGDGLDHGAHDAFAVGLERGEAGAQAVDAEAAGGGLEAASAEGGGCELGAEIAAPLVGGARVALDQGERGFLGAAGADEAQRGDDEALLQQLAGDGH